MFVAVDDRDRRAPVALARNAPVAQPPGDFFLTQAEGRQVCCHRCDAVLERQPIVFARVDGDPSTFFGIPVLPGCGVKGTVGWLGPSRIQDSHDGLDRQLVFQGKRKIPLIVCWHAHHCAIAITHQHVVAHPHRHRYTGEGVCHKQTRGHADFFSQSHLGLGGATFATLLNERSQCRVARCSQGRNRVLRCNRTEGDAHDGVGPGGENVHSALANQLARGVSDLVREGKSHTFALANPVFLHQFDAFGPTWHGITRDVGQQFLGVLCDGQVVTRDFALFHHRTGAPALAVNHLLVGQHSHIHRVPVDDLGLAVGNAFFEHLQKQPLVPLVIFGCARGHLAAPVDGQAHGLHLLLHVGDVLKGPLGWRHAVFQRRVFGRQAKRVPTHGHQHVVAVHAQVTREHVVDGVVAHMAHVQLAARVGQHGAGVELLFWLSVRIHCVFVDAVGVGGLPMGLGSGFDVEVLVFVLHGGGSVRAACR